MEAQQAVVDSSLVEHQLIAKLSLKVSCHVAYCLQSLPRQRQRHWLSSQPFFFTNLLIVFFSAQRKLLRRPSPKELKEKNIIPSSSGWKKRDVMAKLAR